MVAHNSFVHAFVETGLIGGTFFAGAFLLGHRMVCPPSATRRLLGPRQFVHRTSAIRVGHSGRATSPACFSLSRNYTVPTYLMLGLATAYMRVALPNPPDDYRLTRIPILRLILIGVGALVFLEAVHPEPGSIRF